MQRKTIVVSAISVRSGGTLSILQDCLNELNSKDYSRFKIVAIVKDRTLLDQVSPDIQFIEVDGSTSYLKRLYYEYFYFKKLSIEIKPALWLSLHDVTPNVFADRRAVYCHNPVLFYKMPFKYFIFEPTLAVFKFFYWFIYYKNISRNSFVIVQQNWIRKYFSKNFGLTPSKIIVAYPNNEVSDQSQELSDVPKTFLFPTMPRPFKNIELIGKATQILESEGIQDFAVIITIEGIENRYSKWILKQFGHLPQLKFIGKQSRSEIFKLYARVDCLIFPSTIETWGLPISEFSGFNKPMLLADLSYAHETSNDHKKVSFFDPTSPIELACQMKKVISNQISFQSPAYQHVEQPFSNSWKNLFKILLENI